MRYGIAIAACLAMCLPAFAAGPECLFLDRGAVELPLSQGDGITDEEIELHYDGECAGGMTVNQYPLTWAVRVTPTQDYALVAIRYYQWDEPFPVTEVRVYDAGSTSVPGTLVRSQPYTPADTGWNRVELDSLFPVIAARDFWVSVHMNRYPPTPCIGRDAGPIVTSRNYVYVPGYGWNKLENISGWANMCLRAVVESGTGVEEIIGPTEQAAWHRLWPSPLRFVGHVTYQARQAGNVELSIYDVAGNLVRTISDCADKPGKRTLTWNCRTNDGRGVPAGTYLYRLTAGGRTASGKAVVLD